MIVLLSGDLLMFHSSYCKLLWNGMVHLLGGVVYLMNVILLTMFCECYFEVLVGEIK